MKPLIGCTQRLKGMFWVIISHARSQGELCAILFSYISRQVYSEESQENAMDSSFLVEQIHKLRTEILAEHVFPENRIVAFWCIVQTSIFQHIADVQEIPFTLSSLSTSFRTIFPCDSLLLPADNTPYFCKRLCQCIKQASISQAYHVHRNHAGEGGYLSIVNSTWRFVVSYNFLVIRYRRYVSYLGKVMIGVAYGTSKQHPKCDTSDKRVPKGNFILS